jgi:hypothetical protein
MDLNVLDKFQGRYFSCTHSVILHKKTEKEGAEIQTLISGGALVYMV